LAEMAALLWLLGRRLGGLEWPQLAATAGRSALGAAAMAAILLWLGRFDAGQSPLLFGAAGLAIGALIYLAAALALRMPEVQMVRRWIRR
ncbi:MAG: hypothetical protein ACP5UQ_16100, partial [Anaerolineae bacterium]